MNIKKIGLTILGIITGVGMAWGNGFHSSVSDAASLGMSTAGITRTEAATTAIDMPAAMSFLEGGSHVLGGLVRAETAFEFKGDAGSSETDTPAGLGIVGAFVWTNESCSFGIGQSFPFNSAIDWGDEWQGRANIRAVTLAIGNTSTVAAYRIKGGDASIGLGLDFYGGTVLLKKSTVINEDMEVPVELGGTGSSEGVNASFFYNGDKVAVGLAHHTASTFKGEGAAQFDTSKAKVLTSTFADGDVKVDILLPSVTRLGVSFKDSKVNPTYFAELTATRTGWSNFRELRIDFLKDKPKDAEIQDKSWEDTTSFELGGYYAFKGSNQEDSMKLRGGIFYAPTPIPAKTLDPFTPDTGRTGASIGIGLKQGKFLIDVSYLTLTFTEGDSELPALSGTYKGSAQVIAASAGYRF
ncbi:outer membrane protein transport protein [Deltaproteobacteria bacterium TL4]